MYYVYLLRCKDNSLYCGYTNDVAARVITHNSGKDAKYTKSRLPVTLCYYEAFETKSEALKREVEIKKLNKTAKEALIKAGGAHGTNNSAL